MSHLMKLKTRDTLGLSRHVEDRTILHRQRDVANVNIERELYEWIHSTTPRLDLGDIGVYALPTALNSAKARLTAIGAGSLAEVGDMTLTGGVEIRSGGLIAAEPFIKGHGLPVATGTTMPPGILLARVDTWPQDEAVLVADVLDLRNKVLEIDRDRVSHLYVIAREVLALPGAKISYRPKLSRGQGVPGQSGQDGASFDRETSHNDKHHAPSGGDGADGADGGPGRDGVDAPALSLYVLTSDGMPDLLLPGQKGGQGGRGGHGGQGGHGERGRRSSVKKVFGKPYDCRHGVGFGGDGGEGGDGGQGGAGGRGGDGAGVEICTQASTLESMMTGRTFTVDIGPGEGGEPGIPGRPGEGGLGGKAGENAGWPCRSQPERAGQPGMPGKQTGHLGKGEPGRAGTLTFNTITREDWEMKLESPWLLRAEPAAGFSGESVVLHGEHLPDRSKVHFRHPDGPTSDLRARSLSDQRLEFRTPLYSRPGEHEVRAIAPDGDQSNPVPFRIRPKITKVEIDGVNAKYVRPGDLLHLRGRSFSTNASVRFGNRWLPIEERSDRHLSARLPRKEGFSPGGPSSLSVRNEDGLMSNELRLFLLPCLDSGFSSAVHGYAFENFSCGDPSSTTFRRTFGKTEIIKEALRQPILLGAFYVFYKEYLDGTLGSGYCTAIAGSSLRRFHEGVTDLHSAYPKSEEDPPPIGRALMNELVVSQGRLLSKELLCHYYNQSSQGLRGLESALQEIEADLLDGRGVDTARTVSFLPSGNIWDSGFYSRLKKSHCVVPTRFVYQRDLGDLDGAQLFVYDSNFPGDDERSIELARDPGGQLHFTYGEYSSTGGYTLGTCPLSLALLQDVDLPFSDAFGAPRFALDLLSGPAWLSLTSPEGGRLGYHDSKIYSDPEYGFVSPFVENLILTRAESSRSFSRTVEGLADSEYDFSYFHPDGRSLTLKGIATRPGVRDVFTLSADLSEIRIENGADEKEFRIYFGDHSEKGNKSVSLAFTLEPGEVAQFGARSWMRDFELVGPERDLDIALTVNMTRKDGAGEEVKKRCRTSQNERLRINVTDWTHLGQTLRLERPSNP